LGCCRCYQYDKHVEDIQELIVCSRIAVPIGDAQVHNKMLLLTTHHYLCSLERKQLYSLVCLISKSAAHPCSLLKQKATILVGSGLPVSIYSYLVVINIGHDRLPRIVRRYLSLLVFDCSVEMPQNLNQCPGNLLSPFLLVLRVCRIINSVLVAMMVTVR
jgi:hypothetical protein